MGPPKVPEAVAEDGQALEFASTELQADREMVRIAVAKNRSIAVDYVVWALFALIGATLGNMRVGEPSAGWTVQAAIWTLATHNFNNLVDIAAWLPCTRSRQISQ